MIEDKIINILDNKFERYDIKNNKIEGEELKYKIKTFLTFLRYELSLSLIDIEYYFNIYFRGYQLKQSLAKYFSAISELKHFLSEEDKLTDVLMRWEYMYRTCMLANNHKLAMTALENISKIYGVYKINENVSEKEFKFDINIVDKVDKKDKE